jgi:hypothetical protein
MVTGRSPWASTLVVTELEVVTMSTLSRSEREARHVRAWRDRPDDGTAFVRRSRPVLFVTPAIAGTALLALSRHATDPATLEERLR